jgi:predicted nuclease of predicted toxin-antitoxin system
MRFKLDENADPRWRIPLEEAGLHVSTVAEEHLQGAKDPVIAKKCKELGLCLITVINCQACIMPPDAISPRIKIL